ncbi:hypothetical protein [Nocardia farcinica]|uniref:hypothetical protein n=1 Tax=Nocardia farcinica TaxID=37329 RepID=UPI002455BC3B|nr:hypothetical protein [Nocardia farcinica]
MTDIGFAGFAADCGVVALAVDRRLAGSRSGCGVVATAAAPAVSASWVSEREPPSTRSAAASMARPGSSAGVPSSAVRATCGISPVCPGERASSANRAWSSATVICGPGPSVRRITPTTTPTKAATKTAMPTITMRFIVAFPQCLPPRRRGGCRVRTPDSQSPMSTLSENSYLSAI